MRVCLVMMRVCLVITLEEAGLITKIDEYFNPAELEPLLDSGREMEG